MLPMLNTLLRPVGIHLLYQHNENNQSDYLLESKADVEYTIRNLNSTSEYLDRISKSLPKDIHIPNIGEFQDELKTFTTICPSTMDSWVNIWLKNVKTNGITGTCSICNQNESNKINTSCLCSSPEICVKCLLCTYYVQTEGLMKSSFKCPLCRQEISCQTFLNIISNE